MLILASKSASRRAMLDAAGVSYEAVPADVDERAVEALTGGSPADRALALALVKARAVSEDRSDAFVLGSDSLIAVDGRRFDKPESRDEAADHLRFFSGREMQLHSAAAIVKPGTADWSHTEYARLHVRPLSAAFIEDYLDHEWPAIAHCAGAFRIEARGVTLFEAIEGSHFTVLGMPLLPVLAALRERGVGGA
jgi:septum formation protein